MPIQPGHKPDSTGEDPPIPISRGRGQRGSNRQPRADAGQPPSDPAGVVDVESDKQEQVTARVPAAVAAAYRDRLNEVGAHRGAAMSVALGLALELSADEFAERVVRAEGEMRRAQRLARTTRPGAGG